MTQWGMAARGAGATRAKLAHVLLSRRDGRREVLGVAHMLVRWAGENGAEERQMVLILRHLPEGDWSLVETAEGISTVRGDGDFVRVSRAVLGHPEVAQAAKVVHFYGPGATSALDRSLSAGLRVVGRALDAVEIGRLIGAD